jgi:Arc/MetJ-type ribon-helix-helix transcriptional regulator
MSMSNGACVVLSASVEMKHYEAVDKLIQDGKAKNKSEAVRKIFDYWCDRHTA